MADIWITSDTHFNHANVISYEGRPFANKGEMNEILIENWNKVVKEEDTVYHLGDVIFGGTKIKDSILKRLNGHKILRLGNHDQGTTKRKWGEYFDEVYDDDILLDGVFCLSHYPLDEITSLKLINNKIIYGNIHGHLHSNDEKLDPNRYFNVCVEVTNYTPVAYEEIKKHFGIGYIKE